MKKLELLAPAKDLECGIAAIACGADAVYIGADRFSARDKAHNSLDDIETLVKYAHKYWVRVYVALNTLLKDEEIPEAVELIERLYAIGVDALIIQDYGLLEEKLPSIPVFASTQLNNRTPEKVLFLEKAGFQRVILARELDIEQIKTIRAKTTVDLESFVHGALCVAYSGQCYLSYALGGRSGNRGNCAQPCRKKYSLYDDVGNLLAKDKYLLSLKDLNLSAHLKELAEAGITSFKIEGRLKEVTYVKNIVSFYRQELDKIIDDKRFSKASSGTSKISFTPDPTKSFNRGFTEYFLPGRNKELKSLNTPKSIGEYLGKVAAVEGRRFKLDRKIELHNGDGLCYFDPRGEMAGGFVNATGQGFIKLSSSESGALPEIGADIYRNYDIVFDQELNRSVPTRKIDIDLTFNETDNGFFLKAVDEDRVTVTANLDAEKIIANDHVKANASVKEHLTKLGQTDFECKNIYVGTQNSYFIQPKLLNQLRREIVDKLLAERAARYPKLKKTEPQEPNPYPEKQLNFNGNILNRKGAEYLKKHGADVLEPAAESGLDMRGRKIFTGKYCLKYQLGLCASENKSRTYYLVNEQKDRLAVRSNCDTCEMEIYLE